MREALLVAVALALAAQTAGAASYVTLPAGPAGTYYVLPDAYAEGCDSGIECVPCAAVACPIAIDEHTGPVRGYVYIGSGVRLGGKAGLGVQLWRETNGCADLQRTDTVCNGATVPPDEYAFAWYPVP